jgi:hypothetical protein
MQVDPGIDQDGSVERPENVSSAGSKLRELLGNSKSDAFEGANEAEKSRVDPKSARGWSAHRRAAFERAIAARKARTEKNDGILEVKPQIDEKPSPPADPGRINHWAEVIYVAHQTFASFVKIEELKLSQEEAKQVSAAAANVARHYANFIISEKTADILNLGMISLWIYGPRIRAIKARANAVKKQKAAMSGNGGVHMAERPPEVVTQEELDNAV